MNFKDNAVFLQQNLRKNYGIQRYDWSFYDTYYDQFDYNQLPHVGSDFRTRTQRY